MDALTPHWEKAIAIEAEAALSGRTSEEVAAEWHYAAPRAG